jgi:sulfide-quinone reductase (EC 1.-.-.-)
MAEVVVMGAGLGGSLMAYELALELRPGDRITLIGTSSSYQFYPSNPWVAVGWRKRKDVEVDLTSVMKKKKVNFIPMRRSGSILRTTV